MTLGEFQAMALIASFFPLTFVDKTKEWTEFRVLCLDCDVQIPLDRTRGDVTPAFQQRGYRDVSSLSYHVVAHGLCPDCNVLTTADYTLHSDMTCTAVDRKTGSQLRWRAHRPRPAWHVRLMKKVRSIFSR